jgi:hypothetical protein
MGDDPMALLGLEGALKHYYYYLLLAASARSGMAVDPATQPPELFGSPTATPS